MQCVSQITKSPLLSFFPLRITSSDVLLYGRMRVCEGKRGAAEEPQLLGSSFTQDHLPLGFCWWRVSFWRTLGPPGREGLQGGDMEGTHTSVVGSQPLSASCGKRVWWKKGSKFKSKHCSLKPRTGNNPNIHPKRTIATYNCMNRKNSMLSKRCLSQKSSCQWCHSYEVQEDGDRSQSSDYKERGGAQGDFLRG